jgi:hypothetical protein
VIIDRSPQSVRHSRAGEEAEYPPRLHQASTHWSVSYGQAELGGATGPVSCRACRNRDITKRLVRTRKIELRQRQALYKNRRLQICELAKKSPKKTANSQSSKSPEDPKEKPAAPGAKRAVAAPALGTVNPEDFGLSEQQVLFADHIVQGKTRVDAYRLAGLPAIR